MFPKLLLLAALIAISSFAQPTREAALKNLKFREIGPAIMGGRIDDVAVVESDPRIIYLGTASAGIFKSVNGGTTWEPIFDDQPTHTIGDIAIAPSDPSILYVGSGEPNNRQSSSWGDGVYKSMDAGRTWSHIGLKETHHIGRVVVHPADPGIVYVAALGRLWGPNRERGVYKSADGGATWKQVLFINEDTGVSDIAIDPQSPNTLYACAYQRRRTVFGYNGGGPDGGLYKTTDGGAHWTRLTQGLPQGGDTGRLAVEVYRKNPNIVYALVEHARGGIFRSEDKGLSWARMSDTNPRPSYYSQLRIDPNNDQRVWVLGAPLFLTEDGGRTFRQDRWPKLHSDFHGLWINPADSNHLVIGGDGGVAITFDSGRNWDFVNNIALGQFYEIGVDMQKPYRICGGLQDNNSWCGPSATLYTRGISNDEWVSVSGGDGFYAQIDPTDPNIIYTESQDGNLQRRDMRSTQAKSIRPLEDNDKAPRYRFQWNSPVMISRHDPKTIYYGGNHLFKSKDRGDSWERLGPDLTSGIERDKQPILGRVPDRSTLSRHDGVQQFPCISTIAESPRNAGVLWAGTDDGNVQMTRDGGKTWSNVAGRISGVRKGAYVSRVIASQHNDGTAYVTFDNHRSDDFSVYVYKTTNYGDSWTRISNGIPPEAGTVNVIREHHRTPNLLFAGAEFGLYVSFDAGANWQRMKNGLPTVPVDDIVIHPRDNDLILGTHGRSIWIMDDIAPLEQLADSVLASDLHAFDVRPATMWSMFNHKQYWGAKEYVVPNPPAGAGINYYLKSKPAGPVRITVKDSTGAQIRQIVVANAEAGVNRTMWDMRYDPAVRLEGQGGGPGGAGGGGGGRGGRGGGGGAQAGAQAQPQQPLASTGAEPQAEGAAPGGVPGAAGGTPGAAGGGGGGRFGGAGRGPLVDPGEYSVTITVAGKSVTRNVTVEEDPRITISTEDRARRRQAITRLYSMSREADAARRRIVAMRTSLTALTDGWKRPGAPRVPEAVTKAVADLLAKATVAAREFETARPEGQLGGAGPALTYTPPPIPQKLGRLLGSIDSFTAAPTAKQMSDLEDSAAQLQSALAQVKMLADDELPKLNKLMAEAGVPYVSAL